MLGVLNNYYEKLVVNMYDGPPSAPTTANQLVRLSRYKPQAGLLA
jgi:hypothetical protein